jgi:hypothetical protein
VKVTSVEVTDDRVIIRREGVNAQIIGLTFAEVACASDALRAFLLPLVPVEVPVASPVVLGHGKCTYCNGSGRLYSDSSLYDERDCWHCKGSGRVVAP